MKKFYSPGTGGFYDEEVHGLRLIEDARGKLIANPDCCMPVDVVEISNEEHAELLEGESSGKRITANEDGYPVLTDPPRPSSEEVAAFERQWRDGALQAAIWLRERHRDQQEIGTDTSLTAEQFAALLVYMQALRDWPQSQQFPEIEHRPVAPPWIAEQTQ
ncbi:phage tail assembly chaperone [Pseudomonas sp. 2848]|jgi:hypothetical protein|uniref:phage tail assembly chaperone n=1 Tax=Pseudomonas sp. 2848 TaxID=2183926 RepID=UPI000DAEE7C7|nr:phage tail assembly chaperone [Pseudomonas sp. 2848]PZW75538.1 phage tail assembly chaperone [Pseudomonas sp. 2848]